MRIHEKDKQDADLEVALECFRNSWEYDELFHYNSSNPIYHYTSPKGFFNILQAGNVNLWFSRYDSLNDVMEGKNIFKIYQAVCDQLRESQLINEEFYQAIYDLQIPEKEFFSYYDESSNTSEIKAQEYERYLCCFSKNRDSLPMWNYYSKEGKYEGYNIGVSFFDMHLHSTHVNDHILKLYTVVYDDREKANQIKKQILFYYSLFKNFKNHITTIRNFLSTFLKSLSLIFKESCFSHEEEVRAILTVSTNQNRFEVKHRQKNGYDIPYIEYSLPITTVKSITIGPLLDEKRTREEVTLMLVDRDYNVTDIRASQIPIRY